MRHLTSGRQSSTTTRRQGSVFPILLISLLLVSATAAVLVKTTLTQRSIVRSEELRLQADWLVHSATARAAAALAADATWTGETWQIPADQLGQSHGATVDIAISLSDQNPNRHQADITVNYPSQGEHRVRLSRRVLIKPVEE